MNRSFINIVSNAFILFFLAWSPSWALDCSLDRENPLCKKAIDSGLIIPAAQKEVLAIQCFNKAKVDTKQIKGTNCNFTTSDSGNTAYFHCDQHETSVKDCTTLKPKLNYKEKPNEPEESYYAQNQKWLKRDFEKCYNKVKKTITKNTQNLNFNNCKFLQSGSGNTVYAECPVTSIEIIGCKSSSPPQYSEIDSKTVSTKKDKPHLIGHAGEPDKNSIEDEVGSAQ